jgi:hypothetical protein
MADVPHIISLSMYNAHILYTLEYSIVFIYVNCVIIILYLHGASTVALLIIV